MLTILSILFICILILSLSVLYFNIMKDIVKKALQEQNKQLLEQNRDLEKKIREINNLLFDIVNGNTKAKN